MGAIHIGISGWRYEPWRGVFALREKLGPFPWQFPPLLRFDADKVEHFLSLLPHDTGRPLRHAVEVRRSMRSG